MRLATGEETEELPRKSRKRVDCLSEKRAKALFAKAASRDRTYGRSSALEEGE
jgi:hypothetical protein